MTATYQDETITFGGAPVGNVALSGFVTGDDASVVTAMPTADFSGITELTTIGENVYINASATPYEVGVIGGHKAT